MKGIRLFIPVLCLALVLSACADKAPATEPEEAPAATSPTQAAVPLDALSAFRADMQPPVIAVANLDFPEENTYQGVMEHLNRTYPKWLEEMDFIGNIPEERLVYAGRKEDCSWLLCVVPRDPGASVRVSVDSYLSEEDIAEPMPVYSSETGEPFLLLTDCDEYTVVTVTVTDSQGRGVRWYPNWGSEESVSGDDYSGAMVMVFSPLPERSFYESYKEAGWFAPPDASHLGGNLFLSDYGYALELSYEPGQFWDGTASLYITAEYDSMTLSHVGSWVFSGERLRLELSDLATGELGIRGDYPVLFDPLLSGQLWIGRTEEGAGLPWFSEEMAYDQLSPAFSEERSPYDNLLAQGGYIPEVEDLEGSFWLSSWGYGLELMGDSVPGNNGGWAAVYDVDADGVYTQSYSGSWRLEEDKLYLSLTPLGNGYLVDDSFPVVILDGWLWIGRSENGTALPHVPSDVIMDTLEQPGG